MSFSHVLYSLFLFVPCIHLSGKLYRFVYMKICRDIKNHSMRSGLGKFSAFPLYNRRYQSQTKIVSSKKKKSFEEPLQNMGNLKVRVKYSY